METAYDWITVAIFAGLVTHFLNDSAKPERTGPSIWHYLAAAAGCAVANWLGNEGAHLAAIAVIAATLLYAFYFLIRERRPPQEH